MPEELRTRIATAAAGNPLFISEMLAMTHEAGDHVEVPPTLKALLAMRLDQLDDAERRVLERGSVEGEIFHRGAVQALAPEELHVTTRLAALVRRQLVRPDRAQLTGEDGYRFRHLLIRDTAYDALPKGVRVDLHQRFAAWLDQHGQELVERDEIVGYHLEQATRYQAELGQPDPALADRAAVRLATAGRRANDRQDYRTGLALLTRAVELLRPLRFDLALELEAAWTNFDAHAVALEADVVAIRGEAAGDRSGAMLARALALLGRMLSGDVSTLDEQEELCRAALPVEEERDDPRRLALLWELLAHGAHNRMQLNDAVDAFERALRYRRVAGDSPSGSGYEWSLILGPRPADEALRMLDVLAVGRPPGASDLGRAVLLAMVGRSDEAWPLAEARSAHLREVVGGGYRGQEYLALIAMIEGDRQRACLYNAEVVDIDTGSSDGVAASYRLILARDLCYLGRPEEAEPLLRQAQAVTAGPLERALAPCVEALLHAEQGELKEAEALARVGVSAAETEMDNVWFKGWCNEDLATVLERAGRADEARAALERALAHWERKRLLPYADRVRAQIDSFGPAKV